MIVALAEDLPPAVRGRMKLWFVEIKPGVFVSSVKDVVADKVVDYLISFGDISGMVLIREMKKAPYFQLRFIGQKISKVKMISGYPMFFDTIREGI